MKKYNIINNSLGWLCFIIAAVSYLLTLEPTASFWDCPEFILQAFKLEVGHPPGNPIFMLAGRFFVNFAGGDVTKVALMVNAMSGLLSAGTILLLFWTITHLVKRLIVPDDASDISLTKMIVIFGSGICGALMYAWSDTFWFSAVEGEVYAFSSFCTALVFWLILKWENRADRPHSDKYLIFIAYIIGISIAVHLLNLLCIPAIVLVIYYKKWKNTTAKGSLIALAISFVIVALILYGLVPGFIEVSQYFELFCVNVLGMPFNVGVLIYAAILVAALIWTIRTLYKQDNPNAIRISFMVSVFLSGIPFIGDNLLIPVLFMAALGVWLFMAKKLPVRILNLVAISILVIFAGYSSYALLLIRSSAHTPMNQNAPDNVFALSSYLNREQYGDRPLFYGETLNSSPVYTVNSDGTTSPVVSEGHALYARQVKDSPDEPDRYIMTGHKKEYEMMPELNMVFPRIYSSAHATGYSDWIGGLRGKPVEATQYVNPDGSTYQRTTRIKPTMSENIAYLVTYQLNHMYWRYFMWNFAGRQNDIQGNGEPNQGNWISGIPFIDNPRLGDQSLLPDEWGKGNAGHNVFYMLPLLLGFIGLLWQAFTSKRGIEQFWVIFFLFFMTGIAIVLYLNQTPAQPRERDYAFAGSFYAFAIWVGMGVAGLWRIFISATARKKNAAATSATEQAPEAKQNRMSLVGAVIAAIIGILVPIQVVSQTWDDHDRSGRYTTRDFGQNYLNSLDENAIVFTNGDNDTFPLWYAQEVEGTRTDVKVVNLSYLTTDWYADQIRRASYEAPGIDMLAKPADYAYDRMQFAYFYDPDSSRVSVLESLADVYSGKNNHIFDAPLMQKLNMYIPVDRDAAVKSGRVTAGQGPLLPDTMDLNLLADEEIISKRGLRLSSLLALDMLATSAKNGWNRPLYFAMTVPNEYYVGLSPYMHNTGLTYEVTPLRNASNYPNVNTDKMYRNVTERFRWGGLDKVTKPGEIYLDETVRRMVTTHRSSMLDLATALYNEGIMARDSASAEYSADRLAKALHVLDMIREKLPEAAMPYSYQVGPDMGDLYARIGAATGDKNATETGLKIMRDQILRCSDLILYFQSLSPRLYSMLPLNHRAIDSYFFMDMIQNYHTDGGDAAKLLEELQQRGVNLDRSQSLYEATTQRQ
ncbi:MAG: DUF2723 domain-containing protein [Muribaculaceae bacterium]|nr:DUF2723 domain-containing protein [Muribaculaceae bacterium]